MVGAFKIYTTQHLCRKTSVEYKKKSAEEHAFVFNGAVGAWLMISEAHTN